MKDINLAGNAREMTDFLGNTWKYDCLGCAIRENKILPPGGSIYESENCTVQQDPEIPIEGFMIINVKRHVNSIAALTKEERYELIDLIHQTIKALKELSITQEVTIVQEERSKHLHIWVFPNHPWMCEKFGKGITYLREISSYAQQNATTKDIEKVLETIERMKEYFEKDRIKNESK